MPPRGVNSAKRKRQYEHIKESEEARGAWALGARTSDILRVVLVDGARMTAVGIVIGVAGAAALSRLLRALLFGVTPLDTATFMAAPPILALTAVAASVVPALRASRVDAAVALRQEWEIVTRHVNESVVGEPARSIAGEAPHRRRTDSVISILHDRSTFKTVPCCRRPVSSPAHV
jgi:predicted lysophospholipase L1 biosynthesis ABC-type transport system permease subunit